MLIVRCWGLFIVVTCGCMMVGTFSICMVTSEGLTDAVVGCEKEREYRYNGTSG